MATAILVDGEFFLRRFEHSFPDHDQDDPKIVAAGLQLLANWHIVQRIGPTNVTDQLARHNLLEESREFYRIFFYDCEPLKKRMHTPLGKKSKNFGETKDAIFRMALHSELQKLRKIALRLGRLNDTARWKLSIEATERLIANPSSFEAIDEDFKIDTVQKGVDMRLGLDVASLAFKKQVDQIVIVSADADFVPAAKLARREGIDVILDRMGAKNAAKDLIDHVDGIRDCYLPKPPAIKL
jgi:uncharacterized protein (TIGR00288 family)